MDSWGKKKDGSDMRSQKNQILIDFIQKTKDLFYQGHIQLALQLFFENQQIYLNEKTNFLDKTGFLVEYGKLLVINIRNYQPAIKAISTLKLALKFLLEYKTQHTAPLIQKNTVIDIFHATILDYIGFAYYFQAFKQPERDFQKALGWIEQSLQIQENLKQDEILSETLFHRGLISEFSSDLAKAKQDYLESSRLGSKLRKSYAFRHLSSIAQKQKDLSTAIDYMEQTLKLRQEIHFIFGLAYTHWDLGNLYSQVSKKGLALDHFKQAITIATKISDQRCLMFVFDSLGEFYEHQGEKRKAMETYQKGKIAAQAINHIDNIKYFSEKLLNNKHDLRN